MAFSLFDGKGTSIDDQRFTWRDLVQKPISKLDDDAFTRVRIILINGLEHEALRFGHMAARFNAELRLPLAKIRRTEQHQATMVNWLIAADHSPLETGHFHMPCDALKQFGKRDPAEIVTADFAAPLAFRSQREFVRKVLASEVDLRTNGTQFVPRDQESAQSILYRDMANHDGSPSEAVASGYFWTPGTELRRKGTASAMGGIAP